MAASPASFSGKMTTHSLQSTNSGRNGYIQSLANTTGMAPGTKPLKTCTSICCRPVGPTKRRCWPRVRCMSSWPRWIHCIPGQNVVESIYPCCHADRKTTFRLQSGDCSHCEDYQCRLREMIGSFRQHMYRCLQSVDRSMDPFEVMVVSGLDLWIDQYG
jgi:hypothetical protein